jgi:YegS/Rv2252/BmrU family lipid kinase
MNPKILVIINPNAGRKLAKLDWPLIESQLISRQIPFEVRFTRFSKEAIKLVAEAIENVGFTKVVAIGGDGTINEVVNGIFQQKRFPTQEITLGVIPIGTGNDWIKMFGLPKKYDQAIDLIQKGNTFIQDVGRVKYHIGNKTNDRYFVNAAGLGFDAMVTDNTNRQKEEGKSSTLSYFTNMIKSLYKYKSPPVKVLINKREVLNGQLFTLSLAIGQYTGGGMRQTPDAIMDDGLFDLMLVDRIAKTKLILNVKKLFDGKINQLDEVTMLRTESLEVVSDANLMIEVDGENIGHGPFEFELIPRSLKVIVGSGSN